MASYLRGLNYMNDAPPKILLTGATGFIGGRLLRNLASSGIRVRCLVRSAARFPGEIPCGVEPQVMEGDLLQPDTLWRAMEGIDTAYYLVHSMGGRSMLQYKAYIQKTSRPPETSPMPLKNPGSSASSISADWGRWRITSPSI